MTVDIVCNLTPEEQIRVEALNIAERFASKRHIPRNESYKNVETMMDIAAKIEQYITEGSNA